MRKSPNERFDRALTRMAPGTLGGRVEAAAPPMASRATQNYRPPPEMAVFSHDGVPPTTASGPYVPRSSCKTLNVLIARAAGTSAMTVTIYKNGASIGTVSTTAAGLIATGSITASFTANSDILTVATTTVGTGTTQPTVQIVLI